MNQNQAIQILINAVNIAVQKGAFNLEEARIIANAVDAFKPKEEPKEEKDKKPKKK